MAKKEVVVHWNPGSSLLLPGETLSAWRSYVPCEDLMHMERPTELKHITQWRKLKQQRLLQ